MTTHDAKLIFTALGFLAVTLSKDNDNASADQARHMAQLVEDFCRETYPEAFPSAMLPEVG